MQFFFNGCTYLGPPLFARQVLVRTGLVEGINFSRGSRDDLAPVELEDHFNPGMCCKRSIVDDLDFLDVSGQCGVHEDVVPARTFQRVIGGVAGGLVVTASPYTGTGSNVEPPISRQKLVPEEIDVLRVRIKVGANDGRGVPCNLFSSTAISKSMDVLRAAVDL